MIDVVKNRWVCLVFLAFTSTYVLLTFLPWLNIWDTGSSAEFSRAVFSGFCHQIPERSFSVGGVQMPVCARCLGIYLGIFAGALAYLLHPHGRIPDSRLILAAAAPLAADGLTQLTGLRESNNYLRLATGFIFGAVVPYYMIPALEAAVSASEAFICRRK